MKKVLMVTDMFPPKLGGRSEKMARRVKYLFRYGWKTEVLTPLTVQRNEGDILLLKEVPKEINIHRTRYFLMNLMPSLKFNKGFLGQKSSNKMWSKIIEMIFIPKGYLRWLPCALVKALGIMRKKDIDVIYTMNNPITLHLIGYILKKITKKPWLAEFRDLWVEYSYATKGPKIINRFLERKVVEYADRVIWYDGFLIEDDYFSNNYPFLPKDKFIKLPYVGYDPNDYKEISRVKKDKFRIFYAGSFYGKDNTPVQFLKGLKYFLGKNQLSSQQMEIVFAGDWCKEYTDCVKQLDLEGILKVKGLISRKQCIEGYINSDVLLLITGTEELDLKGVPSKFWDYVGARKPILALSSPGSKISGIIRQQDLGEVANPMDIEEISEGLSKLYEKYKLGKLHVSPSADLLQIADRENSEKRFADVLNELEKRAENGKR